MTRLKGKVRTILLPDSLCRKLLNYAKKQKIASGEIFLTRNGTPLSRKQIWREMKSICRAAGIASSKVFPHNLRHSHAALLIHLGTLILIVKERLVYEDIQTILRTCGHLYPTTSDEAVKKWMI